MMKLVNWTREGGASWTNVRSERGATDLPPLLLVVDLEATCDDGGSIPRAETEIIEIGAVLVDTEARKLVDEFATFVKPVRHPTLTDFCTRLTSIRQTDVAHAPRFAEAIDRLGRWLGVRRPLFCSWGDYDWNQLGREASHHRLKLPFGQEHLNLKRLFSARLGTTKRFGMSEALAHVGLPLEGTHHRGIDDARNIARLLPWLLDRTAPSTDQADVSISE